MNSASSARGEAGTFSAFRRAASNWSMRADRSSPLVASFLSAAPPDLTLRCSAARQARVRSPPRLLLKPLFICRPPEQISLVSTACVLAWRWQRASNGPKRVEPRAVGEVPRARRLCRGAGLQPAFFSQAGCKPAPRRRQVANLPHPEPGETANRLRGYKERVNFQKQHAVRTRFMTRVRFTVGALGLALICVAGSVQADDEKPQRPSTTRQRPGQDRQQSGFG